MQPQTGNKPLEIEFANLQTDSTTVIIDCRAVEEFEQAHLEHAINIPLQHLSIRQETFPCNKDDTFYVYCRTGNRSSTFVTYLRSIGYPNCQSIAAGFESWGDSSAC
jgi:rhodanese-related sulfurtransferase